MLAPWVAWKSSFWLCLSKPVKGVLKYTLCFIVLKDQRPKLTGPRQKIIIVTICHHCSGIVTWFFFSFHKTFSPKKPWYLKILFFSFGCIPRKNTNTFLFFMSSFGFSSATETAGPSCVTGCLTGHWVFTHHAPISGAAWLCGRDVPACPQPPGAHQRWGLDECLVHSSDVTEGWEVGSNDLIIT